MTERDRLNNLLRDNGVSDERIELLETVIENTAFMKEKLDDAREKIAHTSIAIPYDNGGGQKGIRENPMFKGYESLFKAYMGGMKVILDEVPKPVAQHERQAIDEPKTVLELVRKKRSA